MGLRWSEVREDGLALTDAKTGPRTVPLSSGARAILDRQPRTGSPFVFPSLLDPARPRCLHLPLWDRVRKEAGNRVVGQFELASQGKWCFRA